MGQPLWKTILQCLKTLQVEFPCDPVISLLHYQERRKHRSIQELPHESGQIAALLPIAYKWKQHRCPSTDGWRDKLWSVRIMGSRSANTKERGTDMCHRKADP